MHRRRVPFPFAKKRKLPNTGKVIDGVLHIIVGRHGDDWPFVKDIWLTKVVASSNGFFLEKVCVVVIMKTRSATVRAR